MNLNELALNLTQLEGKKKQVNIAQIKEVVANLGVVFAKLNVCNFLKLAWSIRKNGQEKLNHRCCQE